jgi:TRAP-type C4-dicarboxylate transport system permease small subunit
LAAKLGHLIVSTIDRASHFLLVASGILMVIMSFLATYGVIRRYLFKSPEPYSYELSCIFLIFTFVLAVSTVERENLHIRVDFISNLFSQTVQKILLQIVFPLMGLSVCFFLTWKGLDNALASFSVDERSLSVWKEPLFPVKIVIFIGYAMLFLVLLAKIYRGITSLIPRKRI